MTKLLLYIGKGRVKDEIIIPDPDPIPDPIPSEKYYMKPNSEGDFTQEMFDEAISQGHKYIVLDTEQWDIYYKEYPEKSTHKTFDKISIYYRGEETLTIDCSKVFINCFHNKERVRDKHYVFVPTGAKNVHFKFGIVEGDKYKREFAEGTDEYKNESTILVWSRDGSQDITVEGERISGFMADAVSGTSQYAKRLNFNGRHYSTEVQGLLQSDWYDLNEEDNEKYGTVSFVTGNGYTRLPTFNPFNFTTVFLDERGNQISRVEGCEFLKGVEIPKGARKVSTIVEDLSGVRTTEPGFYIDYKLPFGYSPASNLQVKNTEISDNHRGGLSNLGPYAKVQNCTFRNTQRYWDTKKFPYSTRYEVCLEDAVSKEIEIENCNFEGKFHNILMTHNISAYIRNNTIKGSNGIVLGSLLGGEITGNQFLEGTDNRISGTSGNNFGNVEVSDNSGYASIELTPGTRYFNNNFQGGYIRGQGLCYQNTFTKVDIANLKWTKDITNNVFKGLKEGSNPYVPEAVDVYNNKFENFHFHFFHGEKEDDFRLFERCEFKGGYMDGTRKRQNFRKSYSKTDNVFKKCVFDGQTFLHQTSNRPKEEIQSNWYFEDSTFTNLEDVFFELITNGSNDTPVKIVFSNCTFEGSGQFIKNRGLNYQLVLHNCQVSPNIILPEEYSTDKEEIPVRERPIEYENEFEVYLEEDYISFKGLFRYTHLTILDRETNQIQGKLVTKNYKHFIGSENPNRYSFSIDNGVNWKTLN